MNQKVLYTLSVCFLVGEVWFLLPLGLWFFPMFVCFPSQTPQVMARRAVSPSSPANYTMVPFRDVSWPDCFLPVFPSLTCPQDKAYSSVSGALELSWCVRPCASGAKHMQSPPIFVHLCPVHQDSASSCATILPRP